MTLVEVLVAMFVLAVGVLALLATQLRTVSSVREAESQTVVAQAVQNLMEGMQINPTLCGEVNKHIQQCRPVEDDIVSEWTIKRYDEDSAQLQKPGRRIPSLSYKFNRPIQVRSCQRSGWCRNNNVAALDKRDILEDQLGRFEDTLRQVFHNGEAWYIICNDSSGRNMTISGAQPAHNCTGSPGKDPVVVKVLWQIDTEKENSALETNKADNKKLVYTYQARMPD